MQQQICIWLDRAEIVEASESLLIPSEDEVLGLKERCQDLMQHLSQGSKQGEVLWLPCGLSHSAHLKEPEFPRVWRDAKSLTTDF